jgi:hypothetical protein
MRPPISGRDTFGLYAARVSQPRILPRIRDDNGLKT